MDETSSEEIARLTIQIVELNAELDNRCTELVNLKEKIAKMSNQSFEYGKQMGYSEGYKQGWAAALANTEWNIE